jgi:hypothetical protein
MIPRLTINGSELLAVPAVHNLCVFAELVSRICRDESTRPDAVAVEFSHDSVAAVVAWLKELGTGPGTPGRVPCMLGFAKPNRRVHPRYRETALRLQQVHGLPLHAIAPEILRREINFSPMSLLCLSTTDSMIEGIRSALELEIPVYGIDLGEVASGERGQPMMQDPLLSQGDLAAYVRRNESACDPHRDEAVDGRREWAMAARLKHLLLRHRRVLFTGGIGHWWRLRRLLSDPAPAAAAAPSHSEGEQFRRVVVAPSLALSQMDLFPDLTVAYEAVRSLPSSAAERRIDFPAVYRGKLAAASKCAEPRTREAVAAFTRYLTSLSLVHQRRIPDLFMTLHTAKAMISTAFASRLGEELVSRAIEWARPEQWPGLPYLQAARPDPGQPGVPCPGQRVELRLGEERSSPFFLSPASGNQGRVAGFVELPDLPDLDEDRARRDQRARFVPNWVWPPCETLLYGTAYAAAEIADRNARQQSPEPFAGSLHEGVDVKATLRAAVRGERRVQVKVRSARSQSAPSGEAADEPSVFIFEAPEAVSGGSWGTFIAAEPEDIRAWVRDTVRFDEVTRRKGDAFVTSMHYYACREPRCTLRPHVDSVRYLYGVVAFGSPSLSPPQAARWLEASGYATCPVVRWGGAGSVFEHFRREHNLHLDAAQWPQSLVRMAIPYAQRRVIIMAPPGYTLSAPLFREAGARGIALELLPLSHFPAERVAAMRHQYLVHARDANKLDYGTELPAALGESPGSHLELLPERVRAQLELESQ